MANYVIVQVHSITEGRPNIDPPDSYNIILDYYTISSQGVVSETELNVPYFLTQNDPYGMAPTLRQWMIDHPEFPITPYTPPPEPTIDEIRAAMPPVTARQLRLTLVRNGYSLSAIDAAIQALPEGPAKDEAQIEWEYATQFERLAPTLLTIAAALSISAEDIDTMWQQALAA